MKTTTIRTVPTAPDRGPGKRPSTTGRRTFATNGLTPRTGRLRPLASEPPTIWNDRRIEWVEGPFDEILRSLPRIAVFPVVNHHGVEHRAAALMACQWPEDGALSTPSRTQWSGVPTGAGSAWPPPAQPIDVAQALQRMLEAMPTPCWTLGIADDGEWYTLRATWLNASAPAAGADQEAEATQGWITVEHATHWNELHVAAGLRRQRSGASIPMQPVATKLERDRLTDLAETSSAAEHAGRVLRLMRHAAETARAWGHLWLPAETVRTWAQAYVAPTWGRATAADVSAGTRTLANALEIAWRLAEANSGIADIDERNRQGAHLCTVIEELAGSASRTGSAAGHGRGGPLAAVDGHPAVH